MVGALVSAGEPIPAVKIAALNVPDWAVERPRITKLITQDTRWRPHGISNKPAGQGVGRLK